MKSSETIRKLLFALTLACLLAGFSRAQGDAVTARAAVWDAYLTPAEAFTRYVDRQNGLTLWRPAAWREQKAADGDATFFGEDDATIQLLTEKVPEGIGIAQYATATLRHLRRNLDPENVTVRTVYPGGIEGREIALEVEAQGVRSRQTMWMVEQGPAVKMLLFSVKAEAAPRFEPYFKRMVMGLRFHAAGRWDEDFEKLRAAYKLPENLPADRDQRAALLAEAIHAGASSATARTQLAALWQEAPDVALDLLTDANPNVRAAAISAYPSAAINPQVLLWALRDKDAYAGAQAARLLAAAGAEQLKPHLAGLVSEPDALLRLAALLPDEAARGWAEEWLATDKAENHKAALQLALALPLRGLKLPCEKLLRSNQRVVLYNTLEALRMRRETAALPELTRLLEGDLARYAARALGDLGDVSLEERFNARVKEIDQRLETLLKVSPGRVITTVTVVSGKPARRRPPPKAVGAKVAPPPPPAPVITVPKPVADVFIADKDLPETERLALLRGELALAAEKLKYRKRWQEADAAGRTAILAEVAAKPDLAKWSQWAFAPVNATESAVSDATARLNNPATDGATLFPAEATLYAQAPHPAQTLARVDAALGGIQMESVRDQMAFAVFLRSIRERVAASFDATRAREPGAALGVDLQAPISLAAWPGAVSLLERSALAARVTDRARFERFLADYQQDGGKAGEFAVFVSSLARFAGLAPAAVTLGLTDTSRFRAGFTAASLLGTRVFQRQEMLGGLPVTVIERLEIYTQDHTNRDSIYLVYLGDTALLASSRAALADALAAVTGQRAALAAAPAYQRTQQETGEIRYFSRLDALFGLLPENKAANRPEGTESGSLRVTQNSWESVSQAQFADPQWLARAQDFRVADLTLPRHLPRATLVYAGARLSPETAWQTLTETGLIVGGLADAGFGKFMAERMEGEVGLALTDPKAVWQFMGGWPAETPTPFILGFRLKDGELARLAQARNFPLPKAQANGRFLFQRPVYLLPGQPTWYYGVVTDQYLFVAKDFETLKLLEGGDKLVSNPDWQRVAAAETGPLRLLAAYHPSVALDFVRNLLPDKEVGTQYTLQFLNAWANAFHTQRLTLTAQDKELTARLSVAFDRAGRLSSDDLAQGGDVAFAFIVPRGPDLWRQTKLNSLRLRVTAKQNGVAPRLREELAAFAWQKIEANDDKSLTFSVSERRIPPTATVRLPVAGAGFAPYLQSTSSINADAPEIRQLAREIAGADRDGRSVARKIGEWTFGNLKWKKVESASVETLASREADCLEHSELYVALARSLGLPARVVTGAAYSDGSFGAHAWVEIYLGRWVEIDPTWGLLEHVDATHIRFDRETFVYYAMLNQLELEILEARSHVTEAQRDPRTLLAALNEDADKSPGEDAFDFEMTLARVFTGAERAALTDKQKKDLRRAFDKAVGSQLDEYNYLGAHVLRSETQGAESRVLALLGGDLVNITLAAREGVWRIVEIEDTDGPVPLFADLLREVTQPNTSRRRVWDFETPEKSLAYLEDLLKAFGETPQLLLLKAFSLRNQRDALKNSEEPADQEKYKKLDAKAAFKLLQEITRRWPDFAPAHHWLSHEYFDEDKNAEAGLASLRRYNQLEPRDPRGCEELAEELEKLARWPEAEAAYREAIARDPGNSTRHVSLAVFHFRREQLPQAKVALTDAFKLEKEADEVFYTFDDKLADKIEKLSFAEEQRREQFLLLFPQELARSKTGLTSLAEAQNAQNRYPDAAKTMQRVLALGAEFYDYIKLARLGREAKRYAEALAAADQAVKADGDAAAGHYARALALAQLGRKKEALAALQKAVEKSDYYAGQLAEEEELKPLAEMPEFKALLKKAKDEAEKKDPPKP